MRVTPTGIPPQPQEEAEGRPLPSHVSAASQTDEEPAARDVRAATARINLALQSMATHVQFVVDEATGRTVVTVIDNDTNKVIRQIPSAETLAIANSLDKLEGILLHQTA